MRIYLLFFILVLLLAGCSANAEIVNDSNEDSGHACPRGVSDDPFPGKCGHYVDNDGNGFCDLGE